MAKATIDGCKAMVNELFISPEKIKEIRPHELVGGHTYTSCSAILSKNKVVSLRGENVSAIQIRNFGSRSSLEIQRKPAEGKIDYLELNFED